MANLLDSLLEKFRSKPQEDPLVLHTPHGDLNLAKPKDQARFRSIVMEIHRTTDALTRKDIADWRAAWQRAVNVDNPDRQRLYDIYRDVDADLHLSGCITQRRGFVMARSFKLVNAKGDEDTDALHYLDQAWFKQLLRLCHDSIWYGHSLIELGEVTADGCGCICLDGVTLIPRKHVIPEYHRVVINVGDRWEDGADYHQSPWRGRYIEAGQPDDLGLFLKAAQQTIPKKNTLAFWDAFAEIFGMPMRVVKTSTRDPKEWGRLERMLREAGSQLAMLTGAETEVQFVESGRGDAFNVYDKRIDRANSELSKLTIGQTMTIEDGSSLSQSETHLEVFENLVDADRDMLRDIVNNQLIPILIDLGFPLAGLRFEWNDVIDYSPEQQVAFETMVADRYEVDPSYFADKYGMPVGERINRMLPGPSGNGPDDTGEEGKQKNSRPFFD